MKYINDAKYYYLPLNVVWPVSYITTIHATELRRGVLDITLYDKVCEW